MKKINAAVKLTLSTLLCLGYAVVTHATIVDSDFQKTEADLHFEQVLSEFDANNSGNKFEYKNTGTSIGMKMKTASDIKIKWAPENAATNVEAQVVSHYLGRYLQMSDLVVPSGYYTMSGEALAKFKSMVSGASERNKLRILNRQTILSNLQKNPNSMTGVVTLSYDNAEVTELVVVSANTINRAHPLAQMIQASGPRPSSSKIISITKQKTKQGKIPTETEEELAKQLSKVMVLDMLTGQWDRWSGGNLEATWDSNNRVRFFARDNGGAGMKGTGAASKYLKIVSRFDRGQIERLKSLAAEMDSDSAEVARLLQLKSNPSSLRERIKLLLNHVRSMESSYGEKAYF